MKVSFTIAKRTFENGKTTGQFVEEFVCENVHQFHVDEAKQEILVAYNDGKIDILKMYKAEGENGEQWFLVDVKCLQVPLKIV